MTRTLPILAATLLSLGLAAPAQASFIFDLPVVSWPDAPLPDATKGCASPATLADATCPAPRG